MKHKSKYICRTAIFFGLSIKIIRDKCTFTYYLHNTYIKSTVPDGSKEIIPANWLNKKFLEYVRNNDILPKFLTIHMFWLIKSILCNCELEAEESFLLDSLATCRDSPAHFKI